MCTSALMAPVAVELITMSGSEFQLQLAYGETVRDGKRAATELLGHPEELQRWITGTDILDDEYAFFQDSQIFCSLLPECLDVNVKVIRFGSGEEATFDQMVSVALPPGLTIDAVKEEIALRCGLMGNSSKMRLVCKGLYLDDDKELSQYHVDDGDVLHIIAPPDMSAKEVEQVVVAESKTMQTGQDEKMQRISLASAATAAVARGVHCELNQSTAHESLCNNARASSRNRSDKVAKNKGGDEMCRTLGRSHLQRCRSLSAVRRGEASECAMPACEVAQEQVGFDVQPVRPRACREGPARPRPVRASRTSTQRSQLGDQPQAPSHAEVPAAHSSSRKPPCIPIKAWTTAS